MRTQLYGKSEIYKKHLTSYKGIKQCGFTLIELVATIVVLGILAVGASSFLKFGSQIFIEASDRDEIISSARFALERLNRELREAVPNSHRVEFNSNKCIEFMPFKEAAVYINIPLAPSVGSIVTLVPSTMSIPEDEVKDLSVVVYPLIADDIYNPNNDKTFPVKDSDLSLIPNEITLPNDTSFVSGSLTKRIFFFDTAIMYCIEDVGDGNMAELARYEITGRDSLGKPTTRVKRALMAEYILLAESSFNVTGAKRTSNSVAEIRFVFSKNFETMAFINEVHIPNVP